MPQTTPITSDFLANNVKLAIFVLDLESKQLVFTNATFGKLFNLRTGSKIEADALVELVHVEDRQHVVDTYHKLLAEKKGGMWSLGCRYRGRRCAGCAFSQV
ncbi:hypothetical protein GCM10028895_02320 [Pontibacter rugosus]